MPVLKVHNFTAFGIVDETSEHEWQVSKVHCVVVEMSCCVSLGSFPASYSEARV